MLAILTYQELEAKRGYGRMVPFVWHETDCHMGNHMKKFCLNLTSTVWDQMQHQISSIWEAFKFRIAPSVRELLTSNTLICVFRAQDSLVTISNWHLCLVVVQLLSHVWLFVTPWTVPCQASLSFTISWSLLKLISIESVVPSNYLILCHPLLLLPSIFPSIRVFSNESVLCIRWPKYWSFSFSISPSNEYSGLISFRIDWFDLLALKSLLQHHSSKVSILWHSTFLLSISHIHTWLLEKP